MGRGRNTIAENINGWMMKKKKEYPNSSDVIYYCVEQYSHHKCPGAWVINKVTNEYRIVKPHRNHERDALANQTRFARQALKDKSGNGTCREVIDNVRAEFGAEASVALGTYDTKRRIIHREKSRFDPETTEMDKGGNISTTYSRTLDGKPFLLVDKIVNQHRLLVFGSETGLQLLARSFIVFVDGTFDCCPPGYQQMFSFHVYGNA
uniref:FLYWCH-type domain-containing protein n=1 Tax=Caenorhabditis japonica TaxID=281687 RepID=A0A8R1IKT8_CAEJA